MSVDYYDQNAQDFFDGTVSVDMASLYGHFEPLLRHGSLVLDAGCGSGRDSLYFLQKGFRVVAMDASHELAGLATKLTGLPVQVCRFDEFYHDEMFDGIWACASLLHVPANDLPNVMVHLASFLKSKGILYCSFKYGVGEKTKEGRTFTDLDEGGLERILSSTELEPSVVWLTQDLRQGREHEQWLNAVLVKTRRVEI